MFSVGAYLSGGLDSSVIASVAQRTGTGRLDTFSISFSDAAFDESAYQRDMADAPGNRAPGGVRLACRHRPACFRTMIWHTETPVLRTAPAPMFLLSRLVQQTATRWS